MLPRSLRAQSWLLLSPFLFLASLSISLISASLVAQMVKRCPQWGRPGFNPWVGKIPWKREWHPTPVFLPGKSHGQRSLVGYSPWGRKELGHNWATFTFIGFVLSVFPIQMSTFKAYIQLDPNTEIRCKPFWMDLLEFHNTHVWTIKVHNRY